MKKKPVKKAKENNPPINTKETGRISKSGTWMDSFNADTFRFFPHDEYWRSCLIASLFEFFENPDTLLLEEFLHEYKIPRTTWYQWLDKYPDILKANSEVKLIIATRRKRGAMKGQLVVSMATRDLHRYDPETIKDDKYKAEITNLENKDARAAIEKVVEAVFTKKEGE